MIQKWLDEKNIKYQINKQDLAIMLEKDCIWVNGYGEEMHYDKKITICVDTYKTYYCNECIGYNRFRSLEKSTKQKDIIKSLESRL